MNTTNKTRPLKSAVANPDPSPPCLPKILGFLLSPAPQVLGNIAIFIPWGRLVHDKAMLRHCGLIGCAAVALLIVSTSKITIMFSAFWTGFGGTVTSTSFLASFRALLSSTAPHTRRAPCSTWCPC